MKFFWINYIFLPWFALVTHNLCTLKCDTLPSELNKEVTLFVIPSRITEQSLAILVGHTTWRLAPKIQNLRTKIPLSSYFLIQLKPTHKTHPKRKKNGAWREPDNLLFLKTSAPFKQLDFITFFAIWVWCLLHHVFLNLAMVFPQ